MSEFDVLTTTAEPDEATAPRSTGMARSTRTAPPIANT